MVYDSESDDHETLSRQAARQLVEHVDAQGNVIEVVTRAEVRSRTLRHRSVYVAVLNRDRLLVHRRAEWKDVFPGAWDLAFGGLCDVGERWDDAAQRELREEAGIEANLDNLGPVSYEGPEAKIVGFLYRCQHEGPFAFDDGEVSEIAWVSIDELADFVIAHQVPPDSRQIIVRQSLLDTDENRPPI